MVRLIFSILAGFIFTAVLSILVDHIFHLAEIYPPYGVPMRDHLLLLLAFAYRAVFAIGGAYVTAVLARQQAMKAVLIMGIIGSLIWLAGAIAMWEFAYPWYNVLGVLTGVPFAVLGGKLYQRRKKSQLMY